MQESINSQSMLKVGTILRGIYRIDSYLSSGGFGNTYVATNVEFEERVAIKEFFMKGVTQRDDNQTTVSVSNTENSNSFLEQREKFKKEARRIRQLKNPHIVRVHDLFEENGTAYYVMDYVDGENLSDRLKRTGKPMTEDEVNQILPQILDALKPIHDAGIWHLDLKPANIMVDKSGNVKLIDFGASKQLNAQKGGATTSTAISYTNGYAPREQMEQNYDKFGPWTDIYALGATLYNLLTNKRPPLPSDIDDDMSEDKHLALPMPTSVSEQMKTLLLWLMQTNRKERPQNVESVLLRSKMETICGSVSPIHVVRKEVDTTIKDEESELTIVDNIGNDASSETYNSVDESEMGGEEGAALFDKIDGIFIFIAIMISFLCYELILGNTGNFFGGDDTDPINALGVLYSQRVILIVIAVTLFVVLYGLRHFLYTSYDSLWAVLHGEKVIIIVSFLLTFVVYYFVCGNPDNFYGGDRREIPINLLGCLYEINFFAYIPMYFFIFCIGLGIKKLWKSNRTTDL